MINESDIRILAERLGRLQDARMGDMVRTYVREYLQTGIPTGTYGSFTWDGRRIIGAGAVAGLQVLTRSATQTITASGSADLAFATEWYDPGNLWASSTFTAPSHGYYAFTVNLNVNPNSAALLEGDSIVITIASGGPSYHLAYFEVYGAQALASAGIGMCGRTAIEMDAAQTATINCANSTNSDLAFGDAYNTLVIEKIA